MNNSNYDQERLADMAAGIRTELAARGCVAVGVEVRRSAMVEGLLVGVRDRRSGAWVEVCGTDYDRAIGSAPAKMDLEFFMGSLRRFDSAVSGS